MRNIESMLDKLRDNYTLTGNKMSLTLCCRCLLVVLDENTSLSYIIC